MRELEIVGLAAADGLVGPAPAPADEIADGPKHAAAHAECLNCGAALHGRYCASCGQVADDHHRSIFHLMWEAVEGLTHLDGRLARTIPPLFLNPGKLARDHFEGRRQRHVPPFRLFLITLLVFTFSMEAVMHQGGHKAEHKPAASETAKDGVITLKDEKGATTRIVLPTAADVSRWSSAKVSDAQIATELKGKAAAAVEPAPEASPDDDDDAKATAKPNVTAGLPSGVKIDVTPIDASRPPVVITSTNKTTGVEEHDSVTEKRIQGWFEERVAKAQAYPEYYKALVFEWAHRLAILLLPIFAGWLTLLYVYKRKFYVYDHLVVSMQFLSFVFLVSAIAWIMPKPVRDWAVGIASLWVPVNLFMLLRGAYGSGVFGAVVKTTFLWTTTVVGFSIMLVGLLALGLQQL